MSLFEKLFLFPMLKERFEKVSKNVLIRVESKVLTCLSTENWDKEIAYQFVMVSVKNT